MRSIIAESRNKAGVTRSGGIPAFLFPPAGEFPRGKQKRCTAASPALHTSFCDPYFKATDGARTRDLHLGKVAYYQLYYCRALPVFQRAILIIHKINGIVNRFFRSSPLRARRMRASSVISVQIAIRIRRIRSDIQHI